MTEDKIANADESGYALVNDLNMYYEIHGTGKPLVLFHGALSATDTSFGKLLPSLARTRQVIVIEQAHGHTAGAGRPLTIKQMADDTVSLLRQLNIENADFFGYSLGAGIALYIAIRYPDLVRKLVVASVTYNNSGFRPGLLAGMEKLKPENLAGTPWQEEYASIAPNPEDWPTLVEKVKQLDLHIPDLPAEGGQSIKAPTLVIVGDSDIVLPEHAVEMFRLLGGVPEDIDSIPYSQLAVLPGTAHVTLMEHSDWLLSMIGRFLDSTVPDMK
ncbi:alpha/beta fold hydrolase [Methanosarcina sp. T3]|uniref:alpha/beta fold hydrolase n=1 Tax=Methanosarcina sp. T3 TaxID=3439062 RepID=UPI003F874F66